MNANKLVYALSEKGKNDFKIRRVSSVFDSNSQDDSDTQPDTDVEAESSNSAPQDQLTPPQFFQIDKEKVIMLSNRKGSQVYLLGTNHASPESRLAVNSLIKTVNPQIVVVELCKTRIGLNPLKTFERNRLFNLHLLKDAVTELGVSAGFIWYSMAYMERFISRLLNVDYGGDMRAPGTSASFQVTNADLLEGEKHNYKIMLGDRPIEITIKRMASILTLPEKMAIWFFNLSSALLGLRCYLLNVPTVLFRSPKFNYVLLDERDVYLTYSLQIAADISDGPVRVIGIVGKAHVPGILSRWDTVTEEDVRRITNNDAGLWAVINTAGVCLKGKLEQQDSSQWETMFKVNVFGMLRAARTFMPLLKNKKGRLITIGTGNEYKFGSTGAVVYNAARYAVAGASCSLDQEMSVHGVRVITIHTESIPSEKLFVLPKFPRPAEDPKSTPSDRYLKFSIAAVPNYAMNVIEEALLVTNPKEDYYITKPTGFTNYLSAITEKLENIQKKKYNIERTI